MSVFDFREYETFNWQRSSPCVVWWVGKDGGKRRKPSAEDLHGNPFTRPLSADRVVSVPIVATAVASTPGTVETDRTD